MSVMNQLQTWIRRDCNENTKSKSFDFLFLIKVCRLHSSIFLSEFGSGVQRLKEGASVDDVIEFPEMEQKLSVFCFNSIIDLSFVLSPFSFLLILDSNLHFFLFSSHAFVS